MKHFILSTFFALTLNSSFSQTKIIAFKSHSGNPTNFDANLENDNFGENPEMTMVKIYDTVKIISDSQYVEVWHLENQIHFQDSGKNYYYYKDTNFISPNNRIENNVIKENYPSTTIFKSYESNKNRKKKNKTTTNNLWLLYLVLGGSLTPFIFQFFKKNISEK